MDINANICYLLGVRYNEHSRGRVYREAFISPCENTHQENYSDRQQLVESGGKA
jgi:hypothetical protein